LIKTSFQKRFLTALSVLNNIANFFTKLKVTKLMEDFVHFFHPLCDGKSQEWA